MIALTFTCHACGQDRPEDKIGVISRVHPIIDGGGATMTENIRFCTDTALCRTLAQDITLIGDEERFPAASVEVKIPTLGERIKKRWFNR